MLRPSQYDGDGRVDLIQKAGGAHARFVFFPNAAHLVDNRESSPAWGNEQSFRMPFPPFDLDDPSVRTLDLDNDKRIDSMRTTPGGFIYYYNRGDIWEEDGLYLFGEPEMGDLGASDGIDFTDGVGTRLADLNGDRLLDLCRIRLFDRQVEVEYWPNKGRGSWGAGVIMSGTIDIGTVALEDVFLRDGRGNGDSKCLDNPLREVILRNWLSSISFWRDCPRSP